MKPIRVFVSYSRRNDFWIHEGQFNLIPWLGEALKREGVEFWYDRELRKTPGINYREKIENEIDQAHLALLLISQDFIISDFVREVELPRIKQRVEKNELSIIPILVGPVSWEGEEEYKWLTERQIIPGKPTPLIEYIGDRAKWKHVQVEILGAIKNRIREIRATKTGKGEVKRVEDTGDIKNVLSTDQKAERNADGRKQAVELDKQATGLLIQANRALKRGSNREGVDYLRQALAIYDQISLLDPEVAPNAKIIASFISVDLAEVLKRSNDEAHREKSRQLAEKAVSCLEEAAGRGVRKCEGYLQRARRLCSFV